MDKSLAYDPGKAGKTEQQIASDNVPKSGEQPDQGAAPTSDNWSTSPARQSLDERPMEAPDTFGAKHQHPILAQRRRSSPACGSAPSPRWRLASRRCSSPCSLAGARAGWAAARKPC
jgi:hypothetical protein